MRYSMRWIKGTLKCAKLINVNKNEEKKKS